MSSDEPDASDEPTASGDATAADSVLDRVPVERTGVVRAGTHKSLLAELYRYPGSVPPIETPGLDVHTVSIGVSGRAGQGRRRLEGDGWRDVPIEPGLVSLRPAQRAMAWTWDDGDPLEVVNVRFPPAFLRRVARETERNPDRVEMMGTGNTPDPVLVPLGRALLESLTTGEASGVLVETIAESMAVRVLEAHTTRSDPTPTFDGPLADADVRRVRDYVHAHLDADLSLERLAGLVDLSRFHFARMFKKTVGQSPHQYVLQKRVEAARRQLERTNRPIAQIALDTGFSGQSHLTRRFKDELGTTPGAYRREIQT